MHFLRLETCLHTALPKRKKRVLTVAFRVRISGGERLIQLILMGPFRFQGNSSKTNTIEKSSLQASIVFELIEG